MVVNLTTVIGLLASILTSVSLLPQLLKISKEKKAGDISLAMLAILFSGLSLWVYYGVLKEDWILIVANLVSLLLNGFIVVLTLKYKK